MRTAGIAETTDDRAALIQQAFRLEYLTLAWMAIEAVVAIGSGVAADSLTLTAFGIDSVKRLWPGASSRKRCAPATLGGDGGRGDDALCNGRYDDEPYGYRSDGAHSTPVGPMGYRLVPKKAKRRERSQRMQFSGT
jgi:hypothetical protein